MDIRIYIGPHRTASAHIHALLKLNQGLLWDERIHVVHKVDTRKFLMPVNASMRKGRSAQDAYDDFLDDCLAGKPDAERLIICDHRMTSVIRNLANNSMLIPGMKYNFLRWTKFIPTADLTIYGATRSPVTFLPSCYSHMLSNRRNLTFPKFLSDFQPELLNWAYTYARGLVAFGDLSPDDAPLYLWRYEDYPKIWRNVLSAITGYHDPDAFQPLEQKPNQGLSLYGSVLMQKYLIENDVTKKEDIKKVKRSFLDYYPNNGMIIDDPAWSPELLKQMEESYEDDWYSINQMDHVITLGP